MHFEFENLMVWLYRRPTLFRAAGLALFQLGALGLVAGVVAKVVAVITSVATRSTGSAEGIAHHFPGLWTWWVPESPAFVAAYVAIAVAGAILAMTAKRVQHQIRNF